MVEVFYLYLFIDSVDRRLLDIFVHGRWGRCLVVQRLRTQSTALTSQRTVSLRSSTSSRSSTISYRNCVWPGIISPTPDLSLIGLACRSIL